MADYHTLADCDRAEEEARANHERALLDTKIRVLTIQGIIELYRKRPSLELIQSIRAEVEHLVGLPYYSTPLAEFHQIMCNIDRCRISI